MSDSKSTIEVKVERTIPATVDDVFDAWLNPKTPGTPWNMADKLLFHPTVDGLFYLSMKTNAHYGRFTEVKRSSRIQHTWVSPNTSGLESVVTVTFRKQEEGTVMTLVHSGLPDSEGGRSHEKGWNYFLGIFPDHFANASSKTQ